MGNHNNLLDNRKILKQVTKGGFKFKQPGKNKNKYQIFHPDYPLIGCYTIHSGCDNSKKRHELSRYLMKNFNFKLDI